MQTINLSDHIINIARVSIIGRSNWFFKLIIKFLTIVQQSFPFAKARLNTRDCKSIYVMFFGHGLKSDGSHELLSSWYHLQPVRVLIMLRSLE